ncbi:antitoxin [Kribbella sp. NBC_00709]|uniref:antitoxin n=1 Tax=Kribbella sp. NBC_00709 TaxID=2975972 RepID=UPI002E2D18E0|nr:antitoxin [Kribbella sp. NBC_00709]
MNDFQEQAKNWLRNVVKQNPDKIKAGVEKAGDLIDKQTGGKYAEKVDSVQQKVGGFVDKQNSEETPAQQDQTPADTTSESTTAGTAESAQPEAAAQADNTTGSPAESAGSTPTGQQPSAS